MRTFPFSRRQEEVEEDADEDIGERYPRKKWREREFDGIMENESTNGVVKNEGIKKKEERKKMGVKEKLGGREKGRLCERHQEA